MSQITNQDLVRIKNALIQKNALIKQFADAYIKDTLSNLKLIAKSGFASEYFDIGDELVVDYTYEGVKYEYPWVMAGFRNVIKQDGQEHPAIILGSKYATIESIQFDAPENNCPATEETAQDGIYYWGVTGTTWTALNLSAGDTIPYNDYDRIEKNDVNADNNQRSYGYNNYMKSAYRQWLNSPADKGLWHTLSHVGDVAPSSLATYKGFMAGFDQSFLSLIDPVQVKVATNTVNDGGVTDIMYDKFWLPSIEEVYGSPQAAGIEGPYYPYWKAKTGLNAPDNAANSGRIITDLQTKATAQYCRLRSAARGYSRNVCYVGTSGQVSNYGAYTAYGSVPYCAIS